GSEQDAGGHAADIEIEPALCRFVEVVDIVVDRIVISPVGAVVFGVDIANEVQLRLAGGPRRGRLGDAIKDVARVQMKGAAGEGEGAGSHARDLDTQQLRIAFGEHAVEGLELRDGITHGRLSCSERRPCGSDEARLRKPPLAEGTSTYYASERFDPSRRVR